MASDVDGPSNKKVKLSDDKEKTSETSAEDLSAHSRINSFGSFILRQVLDDNPNSKSVFVEGSFEPSDESAVVLLEKLPLIKDSIEKLLNTAELALNLKTNSSSDSNAIHYACYPKVDRGDIKATIIYPATPKHVDKFILEPRFIFYETQDVYQNIVLPHLESKQFSIQWIYNVLEHKSEEDRIVFEDPDPKIGFVLLPDLKWDENEKDSVYLLAISHERNIKSIRDLTTHHLPLLNNIKTKGLEAISKKFSIPPEKLRVYLHYQPSFYHLHIHFTSLNKQFPETQFEKAHLLDNVIQNIKLCSSYYQKVTLPCTLKSSDDLFIKLKECFVIKA